MPWSLHPDLLQDSGRLEIDVSNLEQLLERVQRGEVRVGEAIEKLRTLPFEDLGFAKVDHHRAIRTGFPEVVYAPGKSLEQLAQIARKIADSSSRVLITRAGADAYEVVKETLPEARYSELARVIVVDRHASEAPPTPGVLTVAAGTSDLSVAEEAAITAEVMGNSVERLWDVGIAGVHRLLENLPTLRSARVIVAVAGMEGALPSLIGGLVSAPVIAVPTSVGYGANFQGLAALLTMLNSCSPGVAVVNIDNGFGAGYLAGMINLSSSPG